MNADLSADPGASRPRRLWLYLPFVLLLLIALGWSAVWLYGRHRISAELDTFFAREASLGREWSCPNRSIGGFPFRIEGRCADPSYRQRTAEGEATGSLKGLTVVATTAGAFNLAMSSPNSRGRCWSRRRACRTRSRPGRRPGPASGAASIGWSRPRSRSRALS